jgi:hypothetical protein
MDPSILKREIKIIYNDASMNDIEAFQNTVLRPALKLLHNKILMCFMNQPGFIKNYQAKSSELVKKEQIRKLYMTDPHFKTVVKGMMIACLSDDEAFFFANNERELTKRINTLAAERLSSIAKSDHENINNKSTNEIR